MPECEFELYIFLWMSYIHEININIHGQVFNTELFGPN